jgi:hypothetical protein
MDTMIALYESKAITSPRSVWLKRIVEPLVLACKIPAIPLEIRPLDCAGLCSSGQPDNRIFLSNRLVFWRPVQVANVYLHEVAHRLLDQAPGYVETHGVEFFTLLLTLQIRANSHLNSLGSTSTPVARLDFYDCSENSSVWRRYNIDADNWWTIQINWSISTANDLAKSENTAAEIAKKLPDMWVNQVKEYRNLIDQDALIECERAKELERLRELAHNYKSGLIAMSFCLFIFACAVFTEAAK